MPTPHINIGFDFGTSSTKVCFLDIINEIHHFYVFNNFAHDVDRYCKPSIIRFTDDKIYFNGLSLGYKIELFKVGIEKEIYGPVGINLTISFKAYQLVAIYCAQILKEIIESVNKNFKKPQITYQFGIPVDHLSNTNFPDSAKEKAFKRAFGTAILLISKESNFEGRSSSFIKEMITTCEKEYDDTEDKDQLFNIYPETIAGVGALLSNNTLERRFRYSIVDIGAGTTDISFFQFGDVVNPEGKFFIYHSKTVEVGSRNNYSKIEKSRKIIRDEFREGFGRSFCLYPEYWNSDFNLLFLGGGSRGPLRKFKEDLELLVKGNKFHRDIIHPNEIDFPFPSNCIDEKDHKNVDWKSWFDFLAVSYGLSYPKPMLPEYNPQVPSIQKDSLFQSPDEPITPDVG